MNGGKLSVFSAESDDFNDIVADSIEATGAIIDYLDIGRSVKSVRMMPKSR
jgi:hypothetical protein